MYKGNVIYLLFSKCFTFERSNYVAHKSRSLKTTSAPLPPLSHREWHIEQQLNVHN